MIPLAAQFRHGKATGIGDTSSLWRHQQVLSPRSQPRSLWPVLEANGATTMEVLLHPVYRHRLGLTHPIVHQKCIVQRAIQFAVHLGVINVGY